MSSIDFTLGRLADESHATAAGNPPTYSNNQAFGILRDVLQLRSATSLESATESLVRLLPDNAPLSDEVWSFGEVCLELARQIPYAHPSQLKLVRLLASVGESTKVGQTTDSKSAGEVYFRFKRLGDSARDHFGEPDIANEAAFVNYHAFLANLYEYGIWRRDPTFAIWALRAAFETDHVNSSTRDAWVRAGAQWILWNGQSLSKDVLYHGDVSPDDLRKWKPGPLYKGEPGLSISRWQFWAQGFKAVANESGVSGETLQLAGKSGDLMESLEKNKPI